MYGYLEAEQLVERELQIQNKLSRAKEPLVLNVPLLMGPTGGGKTSLARARALEWELPFCPINSGENSDPTDLAGIPVPANVSSDDARHMEWVLNKYGHMACTEPVFLFFDDLDKAPPPVQSAMLGITGNRMFRDREIHPGTLIMGAGNRLGDDQYANEISESMRTRMTIIEMTPDIASFSHYALATGDIHKIILGYLQYKPEHLHQWKEGVNRFPTPRGWWEVTQHFKAHPEPHDRKGFSEHNWKGIVSRKCGHHVGSDFWAWYDIISKVDVIKLLTTGTLQYNTNEDRRMMQYAAIFAVAQQLTKKVEPRFTGLEGFLDGLASELRVALVVQLPLSVRTQVSKIFPKAASIMMSDIVRTADGSARFRPSSGEEEENAA